MAERSPYVLIYTTWPDAESAKAAGCVLVTERIAACVNVLAEATAIYQWQGQAHSDSEHPMLIKTVGERVDDVIETVHRHHPYDVPAIVVVPIEDGDTTFLQWIAEQTS